MRYFEVYMEPGGCWIVPAGSFKTAASKATRYKAAKITEKRIRENYGGEFKITVREATAEQIAQHKAKIAERDRE